MDPDATDGVVRLRAFRPQDAVAHVAGEDDATVRYLSLGTSTPAGTRRWIAGHAAGWRDGGPVLVAAVELVATGGLTGMVEARRGPLAGVPAGAWNLSYGLYPAARGRGLATRAVRLLSGLLDSSARPAGRPVAVVVRVSPDNPASAAVAVRLGMTEDVPVEAGAEGVLRVFRGTADRVGGRGVPGTSGARVGVVAEGGEDGFG